MLIKLFTIQTFLYLIILRFLKNLRDFLIQLDLPNQQIINKLSFGSRNSMILLKSGMIAICGDNSLGQINIQKGQYLSEFNIIPNLFEVRKIKCTTFITAQNFDRELFIFGSVPFLDQFLVETGNDLWKISGYNLILNYAIGKDFIIINDVKAGVFTCGKNDKGQLGRSKDLGHAFSVVTQLIQVKIKSIKCGYDFVLCELGVKPLHPRDELLIQRMEEVERGIGNEDFPPGLHINEPSMLHFYIYLLVACLN